MVERLKEELRRIAGGSKWRIESGLEGPQGFTMLPEGQRVPKLRGDEQHVVHVLIPGLNIMKGAHLEIITEAATVQQAKHMPKMRLAGKKDSDQLSSWIVFGQGSKSPALAITKIGPYGFVEFKVPRDFSDEMRSKILAFFKALKEKMEREP